jgi:hypothetical protein
VAPTSNSANGANTNSSTQVPFVASGRGEGTPKAQEVPGSKSSTPVLIRRGDAVEGGKKLERKWLSMAGDIDQMNVEAASAAPGHGAATTEEGRGLKRSRDASRSRSASGAGDRRRPDDRRRQRSRDRSVEARDRDSRRDRRDRDSLDRRYERRDNRPRERSRSRSRERRNGGGSLDASRGDRRDRDRDGDRDRDRSRTGDSGDREGRGGDRRKTTAVASEGQTAGRIIGTTAGTAQAGVVGTSSSRLPIH